MKRRHDSLLRNHLSLKAERGVDAIKDVEKAEPNKQVYELLQVVEDRMTEGETAINILADVIRDGDAVDPEKYHMVFEAAVSTMEEMRSLLMELNAQKSVSSEQEKEIQEVFARYIYFVDVFEVNQAIAMETVERLGDGVDSEKPLLTRLSEDAKAFVAISYNEYAQMYGETGVHAEIRRINTEKKLHAPEWIVAYSSKLLETFGKTVDGMKSPLLCADEIYEEVIHDKDLKMSALGLAAALDYMMMHAAQTLNTDSEAASEIESRIQNGLELLRDWWGAQVPEIAVKYEALDAGVSSIITLLHECLETRSLSSNDVDFNSLNVPLHWGGFGKQELTGGQNDVELLH